MKIAFYSPLDPALVGGVRSWLVDFWPRFLETRDSSLHIVHTGTRPSRFAESYLPIPKHPRISIEALRGPALPGSGGRLPSVRKLSRAIANADVCYFDNGYAFQDVAALDAAKNAGVPTISGHHAVIRFGGLHDVAWNWIGKRMMHRFSAAHALNARDAEYLRSVGARNVHIIPIAVDLRTFVPRAVKAEPFTVLFVGRFHYQKGIDRLVRIVQLAHRRYGSEMRFTILGSGPMVAEVNRASLSPNVMLERSGQREEIAEQMSRAHALIVPSRWETFGIVAAEALSAGTPIVATAAGALPEMAADGRGEIILDAENPEQWCNALERMRERYRNDSSYADTIGQATRRYAEAAFSFETTAELFDTMLESVVR
ncbi:MAG: glycosyltransferase [Candidatus Eremiobacteraeota bacterium]|nr:glycosyltransferase [Candidatus Eremiobacteraeota bacterium]